MIRSKKTKEQIFRDGFAMFVNRYIPDYLFNNYITDEDGEGTSKLQEWIINNMREDIMDWCTGIGIIEAVEHLFQVALSNGNLSEELSETEIKYTDDTEEGIKQVKIGEDTLQCGFNSHRLRESDPYHKKEIDFVKEINFQMKFNPNILDDLVGFRIDGKKQYLTNKEETIVLSVIQWLGTHVGQVFLDKVSKM